MLDNGIPPCPRNHPAASRFFYTCPSLPRGDWRCRECIRLSEHASLERRRKKHLSAVLARMSDLPGEEWRSCVRYEGIYEVSSLARVRRVLVTMGARRAGLTLKQRLSTAGYPILRLSMNNVARNEFVHTLVTEAFHGPRPPGQQVNHIDGVKPHNTPDNLEWVTPLENSRHGVRTGLWARGERQGASKLTENDVRLIRASHLPVAALARQLGVTGSCVRRVRNVESWSHI